MPHQQRITSTFWMCAFAPAIISMFECQKYIFNLSVVWPHYFYVYYVVILSAFKYVWNSSKNSTCKLLNIQVFCVVIHFVMVSIRKHSRFAFIPYPWDQCEIGIKSHVEWTTDISGMGFRQIISFFQFDNTFSTFVWIWNFIVQYVCFGGQPTDGIGGRSKNVVSISIRPISMNISGIKQQFLLCNCFTLNHFVSLFLGTSHCSYLLGYWVSLLSIIWFDVCSNIIFIFVYISVCFICPSIIFYPQMRCPKADSAESSKPKGGELGIRIDRNPRIRRRQRERKRRKLKERDKTWL